MASTILAPDGAQKGICVFGAKENNLQNVDIVIPENKLVVITGLSGSGKSSLAFDTIFNEAQRRYMETFSAYARQFLGKLERPDVDDITGLSPAVAIDQKSVSKNPRSTVGTITEIYDFLRLLFAKVSDAFSYNTGKQMVQLTENQVIERVLSSFNDKKVAVFSPLVRGRKGHYRELFESYYKKGFLRARVDGELLELSPLLKVDRYKIHDIDILIDTIQVNEKNIHRLRNSVASAMKLGKGQCLIRDEEDALQKFFSLSLMCEDTGLSYSEPEPNMFSFNSPYGACPNCNGVGQITEIDIEKVFPLPELSIKLGGIAPLGVYRQSWIFYQLDALAAKFGFSLTTPVGKLPEDVLHIILYGTSESLLIKNDYLGVTIGKPVKFEGIVSYIEQQNTDEAPASLQKWAKNFMIKKTCPVCEGKRLKKESLYFKINGKNIAEVSQLQVDTLKQWMSDAANSFNERKKTIAKDILKEIIHRLDFLLSVGLEYLTLSRSARSLSGGESQRIRLATQIASNLTGVLYILDEPSIGLHQRDNIRLIQSLMQLRDKGNSIIVVEHDQEMITSADYIIDIGPGAGPKGGKVVAYGTPKELLACNSLTCQYLNGKKSIPIPLERRKQSEKKIIITGCSGNNLKSIDVIFPLGNIICITGVSGSGKSTLVNETLYPVLSHRLYRAINEPLQFEEIHGIEHINKVIEVNQEPIGKTPRSNPATYTGAFDSIRKLFAEVSQSKIRGYKPGRFSFNVKGGRCETCRGAGKQNIEMGILPDVQVLCKDCGGRRFNRETLEIRYKGKSIYDVLQLTIVQACDFFIDHPAIILPLKAMLHVGLGYLTLGQSSTTLSGGENQRVKLASELAKKDTGKTLYILDEPTTGLHFEDIRILLEIFHHLADKGNTLIIVEHNLDVIKQADYIIDLGPEGGDKGGQVICAGTPEVIALCPESQTGIFLKEILKK